MRSSFAAVAAPVALRAVPFLALLALGGRNGLSAAEPGGAAAVPLPPPTPSVLIRDVTVIDGTDRPPQRHRWVLIVDRRIAALSAEPLAVPSDAVVLDGSDRYLIPGLWDMHAHAIDEGMLPLFLAAGVTGVRSMFSLNPFCSLKGLRQRQLAGELRGPRLTGVDAAVDGPQTRFPRLARLNLHVVDTPEAARAAVRSLLEADEPYVKVFDNLPADAYFALVAEARRQGMPVVGHVPFAVSAGAASDAGQRSIEHLSGVALACARRGPHFRKQLLQERFDPALLSRMEVLAGDDFDEERAAALFATFRRNGTYQVPTLVQKRGLARIDDSERRKDPRRSELPPSIRQAWRTEDVGDEVRLAGLGLRFTPEDRLLLKRLHRSDLKLTGALHRAGVPLLAGTDTPNPDCLPGVGLHEELELLVAAGLSPLEALQTATRNPARFLGLEGQIGTVAPGAIADLVLLDADPLADIRNVGQVRAVVFDGKVLRPEGPRR